MHSRAYGVQTSAAYEEFRSVQGTEPGIKVLNVIIFILVQSFICKSNAVIRLATVSTLGRLAQSV